MIAVDLWSPATQNSPRSWNSRPQSPKRSWSGWLGGWVGGSARRGGRRPGDYGLSPRPVGAAGGPRPSTALPRWGSGDGSGSRGTSTGLGVSPLSSCWVRAGGDRSSVRRRAVPGCTGAAGFEDLAAGPSSTIRPRYMTAIRSAKWAAVERSWVIIRIPAPSRRSASSSLSTPARTETSSIDTGSSARSRSGFKMRRGGDRDPLRCPPDSSWGKRSMNCSAGDSPTRSRASRRSGAARRACRRGRGPAAAPPAA